MPLPDFIMIGAAKSGTTSVYHYLKQHPAIYMSHIKETNYFACDDPLVRKNNMNEFPVTTLAAYQALFPDDDRIKGEISPVYLESAVAAQRIREHIPQAQLFAILRNPIDRAVSGYWMQVRQGREERPIDEALTPDSHAMQVGLYYEKLKWYYDLFPKEHLHIYLFEQFSADNQAVIRAMFRAVGVDDTVPLDTGTRYNTGGDPRSKMVSAVLNNSRLRNTLRPFAPKILRTAARNIRKMNLKAPPEFPASLRATLTDFYRDDMQKVQELTGLDLSHWSKWNG